MSQESDIRTVFVVQGEQAFGTGHGLVLSTILGSCVATCIWDAEAETGGMNHILLADQHATAGPDAYGAFEMERLINAILRAGGRKSHLRAKVFGGASMISGLSDIGARNVTFVDEFLEAERIPVMARSTGGHQARQVRFWPGSGRARQRLAPQSDVREMQVGARPANEVELF
ncbi:MAG: chemotaxis protein CheD [Pseudomonadota bacterium]